MLDNKIEELWPLTGVEDKYNSQGSKFFYAQISNSDISFRSFRRDAFTVSSAIQFDFKLI